MPSTYSGAYPQSRTASMLPTHRLSSSPARIRAIARVILRVTNVSPRRGDSWLNKIPLTAKRPYAAIVSGRPIGEELRRAIW